MVKKNKYQRKASSKKLKTKLPQVIELKNDKDSDNNELSEDEYEDEDFDYDRTRSACADLAARTHCPPVSNHHRQSCCFRVSCVCGPPRTTIATLWSPSR